MSLRSCFVMQDRYYDVSWESFGVCNQNPRDAFEKMCRWLFNEFFFEGKALLHSNPNNAGVEVIPVLHVATNKRISFQAKYFSDMDYEQIKHSARKTIEYYGDELDIVYLYCNKDVTVTSKGYKEVERILKEKNIEIIPINNQAILEQVMKNETIAWQYFNCTSLSHNWFNEQLEYSLALLGPRFNNKFNVPTQSEMSLNYFVCNSEAANEVNETKNNVIKQLKTDNYKYRGCQEVFNSILKAICELEDVTQNTLLDCLLWTETIENSCSKEFNIIKALIDKKKTDKEKAYSEKKQEKIVALTRDIYALSYLRDAAINISPDLHKQLLLKNQVLTVKGNAGVGKSQMFAVTAEKLVSVNRDAVLLLGGNFLSNNSINTQLLDSLSLDISLDGFLHKLEAAGVENNTYSVIFFDAINESVYKDIWKIGLVSLIANIKKYPHIKLAISVRSGYERLVFNDAINNAISSKEISCIVHDGFREESISATFTFLNHYGIPFSPAYFLQSEMTNPLFLKLFCETYNGENYDLFTLFDRLIKKTDEEVQKAVDIQDGVFVLQNLIDEIADVRLKNKALTISQEELFSLGFWDRFGLSSKKIPFVSSLQKSGFLIGRAREGMESYYLAYNLLEDFVCAKAIVKQHSQEPELVEYIKNELLEIKDGKITNYYNIDIFIVVCGLFADKYKKEIFAEIDKLVADKHDNEELCRRYVDSFLWRKASSVNSAEFLEFINSHSVDRDDVFRVLIENSTKENHPLNALFLHNILINKTISYRDALWTTYINGLTDDEERIYQLINYFDNGNLLDGLSEANTELLLILFGWLLTSSNRFLRDKASKAMIELLKRNFALCEKTLRHFETVNDPYVLQRLYGIVFGSCVKRTEESKELYRSLVKYVYEQIFDKDFVYPDILLRDYARLIIARWKHEYSDDCDFFDFSKTTPPYKSAEIPVVERQLYYDYEHKKSGFNSIVSSMTIDHSDVEGMYGDFGRYVFQSALSNFENADIVNLYHYAVQYIRDELEYNDALDYYDSSYSRGSYFRHETKKIERIGKKYEWIAFYNILARVSDRHMIKNWSEPEYQFEGPWDPYVRDFDPTLNTHFLCCKDVPTFELPNFEGELLPIAEYPPIDDILMWTQTNTSFFKSIPSELILTDSEGNNWIALYSYNELNNKNEQPDTNATGFTKGSQKIWYAARASFIKKSDTETLKNNKKLFFSSDYSQGGNTYQIFNREYAWSLGYNVFFKDSWIAHEIESEEYHIEVEKYEFPDYGHIEYDDEGNTVIPFVEKEFEKRVPESVIHIDLMPSYSQYLWEEEYDASQDESTAFYVPCKALIEHLKLEQKQSDGYYCTNEGKLVCFDGNLCNICDSFLIREDYLNKFLLETGLDLFWTCIGEKQFFTGSMSQEWSTWRGLYFLENRTVIGDMEQYAEE